MAWLWLDRARTSAGFCQIAAEQGDTQRMRIALGIDTGGTYTDAVFVTYPGGEVVASAKALTTRHDLAVGIGEAIAAVFAANDAAGQAITPGDVTLVALSTTLATNTLAEGQRGRVCLLLLGYDVDLMREFGFERELATDDVVYIAGGHDGLGNEVASLDEVAAREAILARKDKVEAFAVSGYFSVRNPSHELRVKALAEQLTGLPVTCGHELTSQLNAVRRATTVALNAHLIAPLRELLAAVQETLRAKRIAAPLMVVKGDGSLVRAEFAMHRPIETILSGPAASVIGAWHLAGRRDVWTVDVGGTTTDIAALKGGWPVLNVDGARVGGWRTMIEAVDVYTTGLGGDSHVRVSRGIEPGSDLQIGPRRATPLCLLASEHPGVIRVLREVAAAPPARWDSDLVEFLARGRRGRGGLDAQEQELLERAARGPVQAAAFVERTRTGALVRRRVEVLEERGLLRRAAFTPTDALHVLGVFERWDAEAANLAATALARVAGMTPRELCERIVCRFSERVGTEIVNKVLEDEAGRPDWSREPVAAELLRRALGSDSGDLGCTLTLKRPLVAIGAPVAAYLPSVAASLRTDLVIPEHADVANAVGAVSGSIVQRARIVLNVLGGDGQVRIHGLPGGLADFPDLDSAVQHTEQIMRPHLTALAGQAGAEHVELSLVREDLRAPVKGTVDQDVYLGSTLTYTAAGRPSPARVALEPDED
jgi:N-methylhydantoinase A/oxoprolinase/acetone carboxylase beta subunit